MQHVYVISRKIDFDEFTKFHKQDSFLRQRGKYMSFFNAIYVYLT